MLECPFLSSPSSSSPPSLSLSLSHTHTPTPTPARYDALSNEISKFRDELDAAAALACVLVLRRSGNSACNAMKSLVTCMNRLCECTKEVVSIQVVRAFTPPAHQFNAAALMRVFEGVVEDLGLCVRALDVCSSSSSSSSKNQDVMEERCNDEIMHLRSRTYMSCINSGVLGGEIKVVVDGDDDDNDDDDGAETKVVFVESKTKSEDELKESTPLNIIDDEKHELLVKEVVKEKSVPEKTISNIVCIDSLGSYEFVITNSKGERLCERECLNDEVDEDDERTKWQTRLKRVQDQLRISDGKAVMHFQQLSQLKEKNRKLLSERKRQIEVLAHVKNAMAEREDEFQTHRENYERQIRLLSERCAELEARLK